MGIIQVKDEKGQYNSIEEFLQKKHLDKKMREFIEGCYFDEYQQIIDNRSSFVFLLMWNFFHHGDRLKFQFLPFEEICHDLPIALNNLFLIDKVQCFGYKKKGSDKVEELIELKNFPKEYQEDAELYLEFLYDFLEDVQTIQIDLLVTQSQQNDQIFVQIEWLYNVVLPSVYFNTHPISYCAISYSIENDNSDKEIEIQDSISKHKKRKFNPLQDLFEQT